MQVTKTTIEIFYNKNRIASHRRLRGRKGQYSTVTDHMPEDHQKYLESNGDRFRSWAARIGYNTNTVINALLTSKRAEQQSYRSCMGLLKLADKYSVDRLEAACEKALTYTASPSYKSFKNILVAGQDRRFPLFRNSSSTAPEYSIYPRFNRQSIRLDFTLPTSIWLNTSHFFLYLYCNYPSVLLNADLKTPSQ